MADSGQLRIAHQANGRGDKSRCAARCWHHAGCGLLAPAGRVVLFHHAGGDAPALTDLKVVLFRPGPDITRALAVSLDSREQAGTSF